LKIEDEMIIVGTGYMSDVRQLLKQINLIIQSHKNVFGSVPSVKHVCNHISSWLVKCFYSDTTTNNDEEDDAVVSRPYSVSAILIGYNKLESSIESYQINNAGIYSSSNFVHFGNLNHELLSKIQNLINQYGSRNETVKETIKLIRESNSFLNRDDNIKFDIYKISKEGIVLLDFT
jgi:20S proteasome alpha/beta subunit